MIVGYAISEKTEAEEVHLTEHETSADVEKSIPRSIDAVYNRERRHSSLGYKSPE